MMGMGGSGSGREYTLRSLKRDRPDLAELIICNTYCRSGRYVPRTFLG